VVRLLLYSKVVLLQPVLLQSEVWDHSILSINYLIYGY
jgi:hypothetical protein